MPRELAKKLAQPISFRVLDLVAKEGCGHLVGFVANYEVPVGICQLCLHVFVAAQFVEPANGLEWKLKPLIEFVLPLLGEIARTHDQTSVQVAANQQFLDEQASHDGFSSARIIGQ